MEPTQREWTWRAHPARERPGAAILVVLAILGLSTASALFFGHLTFLLPAATVLILSLNRFLFPSRFRLDAEGIEGIYPLGRQSLLWRDVRRVGRDQRGLWLTTRARPSRLDAWGGMHVLFGGQQRLVSTRIDACLKDITPS